jgi:hypothetical protein
MDEGAKVPGPDALLKPEARITSGNGTSRSRSHRRKKLIRLALALAVAAIVVTAWLLWDRTPTGPPQIVTLPNGLEYQFAGVTYGTKNVPPSLEAKLVNSLPKGLANMTRRYAGPKIGQYNSGASYKETELFVWFQRLETNMPLGITSSTLAARLADQAGVEAGAPSYAAFASSVVWSYAAFPVFPRRSRVLQCNLYPFGGPGNPATPFARVTFPNPLYGDFPQWKPEPVPAMKMAGDLEVRLDEFTAGRQQGGATVVKANGSRGLPVPPAIRGQDTVTAFDVSLISWRGTNEAWVLNSAEISDATGNVLRNNSFHSSINVFRGYSGPQQPGKTVCSETIRGTLWPDEPAWRLKLEVKRAVGFAPEEVVTFKNVPVPAVGATNATTITKKVGGIQIVLTKFARRPNITMNALGMYEMTSQIWVELPRKPAGVALDFLKMTTDAGEAEQYGSGTPEFGYVVYVKTIPTNAQTVDLTFVVQKTRVVEFLVQPPKPK